MPSSLRLLRLLNVVKENAVAHAGWVLGFGHLKGHVTPIIAHDRIRRFITWKVAEEGQPFGITASIHSKFPKVNVARSLFVLLVALDQGEFAVRKNAFGFVVLAG